LFAEEVRSLRPCNHELTLLFLLAVSAANQQRTSRNDCSAEPCPQPRAGPSLFVTASSANSTSFSKQRPDPRNSPEGQSMQWEQGDFRVINARGVLHHPPGCRDRSERAD